MRAMHDKRSSGARVDDRLRQELVNVIQAALSNAVGVEGGICWAMRARSPMHSLPMKARGPRPTFQQPSRTRFAR